LHKALNHPGYTWEDCTPQDQQLAVDEVFRDALEGLNQSLRVGIKELIDRGTEDDYHMLGIS
jgi:hypothetical protein